MSFYSFQATFLFFTAFITFTVPIVDHDYARVLAVLIQAHNHPDTCDIAPKYITNLDLDVVPSCHA